MNGTSLYGDDRPPRGYGHRVTNGTHHPGPVGSLCPSAMSGASAPPRSRSCCSSRRCDGSRRVLSLLILDFIGVAGALFTALAVKLALRGDHLAFSIVWQQTRHWIAFAYLITVLMFARVDLYADRTRRPGFAQIGTALFQATIIALVFALANGQHFSSYYIFYSSLFFGTIYITGAARAPSRASTGWLLEQAGLPAAGAAGGLGQAHRGGRARAREPRADPGADRRLHLADAAPPERAALTRQARRTRRDARRRARPGGDHRRPRLPAGQGGRARRSLSPEWRDRPCRPVDDGDPDRPGRVRARADRARCSRCARRCSRGSTTR